VAVGVAAKGGRGAGGSYAPRMRNPNSSVDSRSCVSTFEINFRNHFSTALRAGGRAGGSGLMPLSEGERALVGADLVNGREEVHHALGIQNLCEIVPEAGPLVTPLPFTLLYPRSPPGGENAPVQRAPSRRPPSARAAVSRAHEAGRGSARLGGEGRGEGGAANPALGARRQRARSCSSAHEAAAARTMLQQRA
jgi:hypothetical protein